MPELPDIELYLHALRPRIVGQPLERVRIANPFLLRSVDPSIDAAVGKRIVDVRRMGKRIVWAFQGDVFLVFHLMIAGRLRWKERGAAIPRKVGLAAFDFPNGTLVLTEAGSRKRASLHVVRGADLEQHNRGGLEVTTAGLAAFADMLTSENHTLKRALIDPQLFSGIGNAYSDEILHSARLSPMRLTHKLTAEEIQSLYDATLHTLATWTERLKAEAGDEFPDKVTAFRPGMAVHGKFGKPCPRCGTPVQRIVYADNECNYCPSCQTGGRLLADRSLSRLLRNDWPRSLDALDEMKSERRAPPKGNPKVPGIV